MSRSQVKPRSVLLSKRANIFYLEHVRVMQKDGRVIWINDRRGDVSGELEPYFNLPERNTVFVMLGKGSSITDAAARRLADAGVVVGFTGSGGTPVLSMADVVFLSPQSEYRPTQYMQSWARMWFDEPARLALAKQFLRQRLQLTLDSWSSLNTLSARQVVIDDGLLRAFDGGIASAPDTGYLLAAEGRWAKGLYKKLARGFGLPEFNRDPGVGRDETVEDRINGLIDHGAYLAYGYAAAVLYTLGISYAFPVLHGKTRRGALVFDVADLIKDAFILPLAFEMGVEGEKQKHFRQAVIDLADREKLLDMLFTFVESCCVKGSGKQ